MKLLVHFFTLGKEQDAMPPRSSLFSAKYENTILVQSIFLLLPVHFFGCYHFGLASFAEIVLLTTRTKQNYVFTCAEQLFKNTQFYTKMR